MALSNCIDCQNPLSPTAKECNICKSTDPFGKNRSLRRRQRWIIAFGILVGSIMFVLFREGVVTWGMVIQLLIRLGQ